MQSSSVVGQYSSCCFPFGRHRAGVLGEPRVAPSTLDHLTAPLMTCVCHCLLRHKHRLVHIHKDTHKLAAKHTEMLSLLSFLFSFLFIIQQLSLPLLVSVLSQLQHAFGCW